MKPPCKTPCKECPFRRASLPGWLGSDTPKGFMRTTLRDTEMPCHLTIDYERKDWRKQLPKARQCAGAAVFFANLGKLSRDSNRVKLQRDLAIVFATPYEFVHHHSRGTQSWDMCDLYKEEGD